MKRILAVIAVLSSLFLFSIPALAAPSLPSFISGTSIKIAYTAANAQAKTFLDSCNDTSYTPYLTAVCGSLLMGVSSSEFLTEDSGKYQYLHFIKPSSTASGLQFYNATGHKSSIGIKGGSNSPLQVLTFKYDPLMGTFDGGTLRTVSQGVLFDYIIDNSVLTVPTTVYPNYGKVGNSALTPPYEYPGYNYFLKIKSAEVPTYKITVKYVYENGSTAASTVEQSFQTGYAYKFASPAIAGYSPSTMEISGWTKAQDETFTVTYRKNDAYQTNNKKLTIRYVFEDGTAAWTDDVSTRTPGYRYSVQSPRVPGFAADRLIVEGYMPGYDYTEKVVYKRIASGQPDPPTYYYLTINYLWRNGQSITSQTTLRLLPGTEYNERSPVFSYFKPDKTYVSGTMPNRDVTVNVYYDETDSPNTGEGDKDDASSGDSGGESSNSSSSGSSGSSSGNSSSDDSGSSSGGSSSGGNDSSSGSGSGGSSSGGSSSGGSSSGSGSSGSGDSGGSSGSSGSSSSGSGSSSGSNSGCVEDSCHCGGSSSNNSCTCDRDCQFCPGGGYWQPGEGAFDNLFPDESKPDTNYPPLHLFDPDDYEYIPPSSSEYDPLEGVDVPKEMPRYPQKPVNLPSSDPFPLPDLSGGGDPFPAPDLSGGGDPFPTPDLSGGGDPFPMPDLAGGDPFPLPNLPGGDPFPLPDWYNKERSILPFRVFSFLHSLFNLV